MTNKTNPNNSLTLRESFLMSLLNKAIKECKSLRERVRAVKPLKIIEISQISAIPGDTIFAIQVTNKNYLLHLSAAEIMSNDMNLHNFSDYHALLIRKAAQGTLLEFLKLSDIHLPTYKIISKRFDRQSKQYIFTIETQDHTCFERSSDELFKEKEVIQRMTADDAYDIGFTQGSESVIREQNELISIKKLEK